tara:strand:- start:1692 stop:2147 length:456 start_codon:yes stop_codon:yes gene_type:complete
MNLQEKEANINIIEKLQESALNIIQPVMERSMVLAAEYADACGRNVILSEDMEYAMKYCAMNEVGKKIGSLFPEIYDESESDEEDIEVINEEDEDIEFERYSGRQYKYVKMNMAYDSWDTWVPKNTTEQILKNAIDSNEHIRSSGMENIGE